MPFFIILFALWLYPILSYLIFRLTIDKELIRKRITFMAIAFTSITLLGIFTGFSTTSEVLDWLLMSNIYLTTSLILWWGWVKRGAMRITAGIVMFIFFGLGYFIGSVGFLGVAFAVGNFDVDHEKWLGDGLIYKEYSRGNAISDYRGKTVELYKTLPWLPIFEWLIQKREYETGITSFVGPLNVQYNQEKQEIYLSAVMQNFKNATDSTWADTLTIR